MTMSVRFFDRVALSTHAHGRAFPALWFRVDPAVGSGLWLAPHRMGEWCAFCLKRAAPSPAS